MSPKSPRQKIPILVNVLKEPMIDIARLVRKSPSMYSAARRLRQMLRGVPEAELHLLRFLVDRDRAAIDVGAHSGLYTAELLNLSPSVFSIEALPELARDLERLYPKAHVINAAASSADGQTTLHVPIGQTGLSTVAPGNPVVAGQCRTVEVDMIAIDSIAVGAVGFIKIDVEGNEFEVLKGAARVLRDHRPVLLIEAEERHRANAVRSIEQWLEPFGYTGLMLENGILRSLNNFDVKNDQDVLPSSLNDLNKGIYKGRYINNFVFIP